MAASTAIHGFGTLLKVDVSTTPTTVIEMQSYGFGISRRMFEVTHMESPTGWAEFVGGIKAAKQLTATGSWIKANAAHQAIHDNIGIDAAAITWQIWFPGAAAADVSFEGWATDFDGSFDLDGPIKFSVTVQPTGVVTMP